jgi:N-acetylmuramoyl-L-alanine amidase
MGRLVALVLALAPIAACAPAATPPAPVPLEPGPRPHAPRLPPIPRVEGPLDLRVTYPSEDALVTTRASNFIFGSTGSGEARLWINDREVEVQPNGAFLAFIPVPHDQVYRLRAARGGESVSLDLPIRLPPAPRIGPEPEIVPGSIYPAGAWVAQSGERIEVGFEGSPGGEATLILADGTRVPLVQVPGPAGRGATPFEVVAGAPDAGPPTGVVADAPDAGPPTGVVAGTEPVWYRGFFTARRIVTADTVVAWPALTAEARPTPLQLLEEQREREAGLPGRRQAVGPRDPGAARGSAPAPEAPPGPGALPPAGAVVELVVGGVAVRRPLPLNLVLADPERPRVGVAWDPDPPERNGNQRHIGRPGPGTGPFHYVWRNGTELELTGERDGNYRVRLADGLTAWSPANKVILSPVGTPPPASRVTTVRMDPQPRWIDVRVALARRLPYLVEEGERSLTLLVFGATSRASFLQHGRVDPFIERGEWSQPADDVFRLDLHLAGRPWGYETYWGEGADLVLRVRRPPAIDPARPLQGLTIAVDPGHGGADRGALGPTGLTEADANLRIALAFGELLEREGARVLMTRMTDSTVSLVQRTDLAETEDADVLISIHNNAFPDGIDPWANNGTSVYYTHPRAAGLAWAIHHELLGQLGLRDIGVGRADFHVPRMTWAPSILTEVMFMMIPEQEAALRDPVIQRRIAEAHLRGLVRWLQDRALGG